MKIGELSRRSGLSNYTIRYYERIGLLPVADRDRAKQRDYDEAILNWISFLKNLKATGMPLARMLDYAHLREEGPHTIPKRRETLQIHREKVKKDIAVLQENLRLLDKKIVAHQAIETEMQDGIENTDWEKRFRTLAKS